MNNKHVHQCSLNRLRQLTDETLVVPMGNDNWQITFNLPQAVGAISVQSFAKLLSQYTDCLKQKHRHLFRCHKYGYDGGKLTLSK